MPCFGGFDVCSICMGYGGLGGASGWYECCRGLLEEGGCIGEY